MGANCIKIIWCSSGVRDLSLAEGIPVQDHRITAYPELERTHRDHSPLLVAGTCWGPALWIHHQGGCFRDQTWVFHLWNVNFPWTCVTVPLTSRSGKLGRLREKGVLKGTPPRAAPAPFYECCVDPKSSQCPILGSTCPPGLAGLAPAHPRPCSNGQGCVLLFVFRSPTDEARWVTTQIFTCGNRLF